MRRIVLRTERDFGDNEKTDAIYRVPTRRKRNVETAYMPSACARWSCGGRTRHAPTNENCPYGIILCLLFLLAACGANATPTPTIAPATPEPMILPEVDIPPGLRVAWAADDDLFLWRPGDDAPRQLVTGDVIAPYLAPDARRIAYTVGGEPGRAESLWVVDREGESPRRVAEANYINQVAWLDSETLYFNTLEATPLGASPRDDLYRVDLRTDDVTLLPYGGQFGFSPDSRYVVLVTAGTYGETPGTVQVVDLSANGDPVERLAFPAVSTGSHTRFYPAVQWLDADTLWTAIPEADLLYNETNGGVVALWRLDVSGEVEQGGSVPASLYGLPVLSPSGSRIAYLTRLPEQNRFELVIAQADGTQPQTIVNGDAGALLPPQWVGNRVVFAHDSAYWIATPGSDPVRWVDLNAQAITQPRVVGDGLVYVTLSASGGFELHYAPVGSAPGGNLLIAATGRNLPTFDAVLEDDEVR